MAFEGQSRIGIRHALPVVDNLYGSPSGINHNDMYGFSSGINGILYQLFDDAGRPL